MLRLKSEVQQNGMSTVEIASILFLVFLLSFALWKYSPSSWVNTITSEAQSLLSKTNNKKDEILVRAQDAIKGVLVDPDSANFKIEKVKVSSAAATVCGTVNSKNRAGGYVGFRRFIWNVYQGEEQFAISGEDIFPKFHISYWDIYCKPE